MTHTVTKQLQHVLLISFIAGYIDAYGLISYATYLSFMSGNTTLTGVSLGSGHLTAALPTLLAILCFVVGVMVGTLFILKGSSLARRLLYLAIASLLALTMAATAVGWTDKLIHIFLISSAMGMMNTPLNAIGSQPVSLTFVTGTLHKMARHFVMAVLRSPVKDAEGKWDTHWRRVALFSRIWFTFLFGTGVAGMLVSSLGVSALLPPLALVILLIFLNPPDEN